MIKLHHAIKLLFTLFMAGDVSAQAWVQIGGSEITHFNFERVGQIISPTPDMNGPGPYYTCLVDMNDVEEFPFEYALYFSTDHVGAGSGIWLYVCNGIPSVAEHWKSYDQAVHDGDFDYLESKPAQNPIFVDTTQGSSTETPHANVIDGTVYMTYHNAHVGEHGSQSTILSTSPDGVNFSRINGDQDSVILHQERSGYEHTGYFRWGPNPFAGVAYDYVGYSLYGGGKNFRSAMWGSNNAIDWDLVEVFIPTEGYAVEGDNILIWHQLDPNTITSIGNGEYIAITTGGNRASGAEARIVEAYEIFLADDGKTMTRQSRKIMAQGVAGADDEEEVAEPTTIRIGDTWHMIYVGVKNGGGVNTVLGATGKLNMNAPVSQPLP